MEFDKIILGGTFDRLHEGHKEFLRFALKMGKKVRIGITSDTYIAANKKGLDILPFSKRKQELKQFLTEEKERITIVAINSKFDQTNISNAENTALLVSSETYPNGLEINRERQKRKLSPLPLLVMPLLLTTTGEKISSSKIREGVLDSQGNLLSDQYIGKQMNIPDTLRESLHNPFGTLYMGKIPAKLTESPKTLVTVGDVTTKRIHEMNIYPKLAIVDFKVERKNTYVDVSQLGFIGNEKVFTAINPSGKIMPSVWETVQESIENFSQWKNSVIVVHGEEDLFVIPLIFLLPLGYTILYGQPQKGVVAVVVTKESKKQLAHLLQQYF